MWTLSMFTYEHFVRSHMNIRNVHMWTLTMFTCEHWQCSHVNVHIWSLCSTLLYMFEYECSHMSSYIIFWHVHMWTFDMFTCEHLTCSYVSIWNVHISIMHMMVHMWIAHVIVHIWMLICDPLHDCSYVSIHMLLNTHDYYTTTIKDIEVPLL